MKAFFRYSLISLMFVSFLMGQGNGNIHGKVSDEKGNALEGAIVHMDGHSIGTLTDEEGRFNLRLDVGDYRCVIYYVGFKRLVRTISVIASGTVRLDVVLTPDKLGTDAVVVIGTRRSSRTVIESPVPVDVFSSAEIKQIQNIPETNQILQTLIPSFNFPRPSITDGTDHVRPATLRGLNPDQTLVMINGKRRHTSALLNVNGSIGRGSSAVDLNAIPSNAIGRIEVLRDGASAQYGSDAISGVINLILKSNPEQALSGSFGQTQESDGRTYKGAANYGVSLLDDGFFHMSAELKFQDVTNRSGEDERQQYFDEDSAKEAGFNRINHRFGDPEVTNVSAFFNTEIPVGKLKAYAFGGTNVREGEAGGFYRRALDNRTVRSIYPDGYLPLIASNVTDYSVNGGLKGHFMDWNWDASGTYGHNAFEFNVKNSVNVSYGNSSPTKFYAGSLIYDHYMGNIDVNGTLSPSVFVAAGAGYRIENYQIKQGEEASYLHGGETILDGPNAGGVSSVGSQVFPGFQPKDGINKDRSNLALYADTEIDATEKLLLSFAGRYENYSDFGPTQTAKVAFRWKILDPVSLRGAISSGFRAPSLAQNYYTTTSTTFNSEGKAFEVRTLPVSNPIAKSLGSKALEPEESLNFSLGMTIVSEDKLSISLDYYKIFIDKRITLSENFTADIVPKAATVFSLNNITGARFFTNAIDTRTEGLDIVLRYVYPFGDGESFRFTYSQNLNQTKILTLRKQPSALLQDDDGRAISEVIGRRERGFIEYGQPSTKSNISFDYHHPKYNVLLRNTYYGSVKSFDNSRVERDQVFNGKWITDLTVTYHINQLLSAHFSGQNLLNIYPDKVREIDGNAFNGKIFPYSQLSPFGFNGAMFSFGLTVEL